MLLIKQIAIEERLVIVHQVLDVVLVLEHLHVALSLFLVCIMDVLVV